MRAESRASLEQLRRLPAALAAPGPITDVVLLPPGEAEVLPPAAVELTQQERDALRNVFFQEMKVAVQRILESQVLASPLMICLHLLRDYWCLLMLNHLQC